MENMENGITRARLPALDPAQAGRGVRQLQHNGGNLDDLANLDPLKSLFAHHEQAQELAQLHITMY